MQDRVKVAVSDVSTISVAHSVKKVARQLFSVCREAGEFSKEQSKACHKCR